MRRSTWVIFGLGILVALAGLGWWRWTPVTVENEIPGERFVVSGWRVNAFLWANGYGRGGEVYHQQSVRGWMY